MNVYRPKRCVVFIFRYLHDLMMFHNKILYTENSKVFLPHIPVRKQREYVPRFEMKC